MAAAIPGRFTAQADEPFVVFLIGMRFNRLLAFSKWIPTALAMEPMLRTSRRLAAAKPPASDCNTRRRDAGDAASAYNISGNRSISHDRIR